MDALFIGQAYIDVTFLTDHLPTGDDKHVAQDYAVSFGGNAVTASFCCAKLGTPPDLLCSLADDWLARMFLDMAAKYGISVHGRKVRESSLSFIMPNNGKRAIVRCRDNDYLHPYPDLNMDGCRVLHVDGHQPEAALHYAEMCRNSGILTSLDGGSLRDNTPQLLQFIDVAVVSELFCEHMTLSPTDTLHYLKSKGCKVGAVTLGEQGLIYFDKDGDIQQMPALAVGSDRVIDTNGAGDIFHGAYIWSYLKRPNLTWAEHFAFSRGASAHSVQHLGNEASLPTLADVEATIAEFA